MNTDRFLRTSLLSMAAFATVTSAGLSAQLSSSSSSGGTTQAAAQVAGQPPVVASSASKQIATLPSFKGDVVDTGGGTHGHGSGGSHGQHGGQGQVRVARLDSAVVGWAPAPSQLVLPLGSRVMLEYSLRQPHLVEWRGAELVDLGNFSSLAEFRAKETGTVAVQIEAVDPNGARLDVVNMAIEVVDVAEYSARFATGALGTASRVVRSAPAGGAESSLFGGLFGGSLAHLGIVSGGTGTGTPAPKPFCITHPCSLTAYAVLLGTDHWRIYYSLCNASACDATYHLSVGTTSPGGKQWVTPSIGKEVLAKGQCTPGGGPTMRFFDVDLIDTDPNTEPAGPAHATLTLNSYGGAVVAFPGYTPAATCAVTVLDICFGCPGT